MGKTKAAILLTLFQLCYKNASACSGEGAGELIHFHSSASTWLFGLSILIVLIIFLLAMKTNRIKKLKIHPWLSFILIIFHPRIWLGTMSGDCGRQLFTSSIVATAMILIVLGLTYKNFRTHLKKLKTAHN